MTDEAQNTLDGLRSAALKAQNNRKKTKRKKSSRQEGLFKQVVKTLSLLTNNPKHQSLNTHEYSGIENPFKAKDKVFEAYAQNKTPGAYRVFWCYGPNSGDITILAITPHP